MGNMSILCEPKPSMQTVLTKCKGDIDIDEIGYNLYQLIGKRIIDEDQKRQA